MKTKDELITEILENEVYMPESKVYQNLAKALTKVPKWDLQNLTLILKLKLPVLTPHEIKMTAKHIKMGGTK